MKEIGPGQVRIAKFDFINKNLFLMYSISNDGIHFGMIKSTLFTENKKKCDHSSSFRLW